MRFRLSAGERSSRYEPGQFVSGSYAARYPHKVSPQEPPEFEEERRERLRVKRERYAEAAEMELYPEEFGDVWEFTLTYKED